MSVLPFAASLPGVLPGDGVAPDAVPGAAAGFMEALAVALAVAPQPAPVAQPAVPAVPGPVAASAPAGGPPTAAAAVHDLRPGMLGPASAALPVAEAASGAPPSSGTTPGASQGTGAQRTTGPGVAGATTATPPAAAAAPSGPAVPVGAVPAVTGPGLPGTGTVSLPAGPGAGADRAGVVPPPASPVAGVPPTAPSPGRPTTDLPTADGAEPLAGGSPLAGAEVPTRATESALRVAETPHSAVRAAVVQQVFPEVTRLTTGGNGTHRITLNLQPEQLGEVRVTLVVRDGAVTVSLGGEAGNSAVQQALSSGAPELRRMLELAGATDARIFVRDAQAMATGTSGQSQGQSQAQHDQPTQGDWSRGQQRDEAGHREHRQPPGREPAPGAAAGVVPTPGHRPPTPGRLDRTI